MNSADTSWLDDLDRAWDDLARREGGGGNVLDPGLATTIRRLHALDRAAAPSGSADRVWQRLAPANPPRIGGTAAPNLGLAPRRRSLLDLFNWRPLSFLATAALVVLTIVGSLLVFESRAPRGTSPSAQEDRLFISDPTGATLLPIDLLTLADLPDDDVVGQLPTDPTTPSVGASPVVDGGLSRRPSSWAASADGSKLLRIDVIERGDAPGEPSVTRVSVAVIGSETGLEISRFEPETWGGWRPLLTVDGSRLIVPFTGTMLVNSDRTEPRPGDPPSWTVYDTASGHVVAVIRTDDPGPSSLPSAWLDPDGKRLLHLVVDADARPPGPWPVQLVEHDIETGAETRRVDLPGVLAGALATPEGGTSPICDPDAASAALGVDVDTLTAEPALAFSPNGEQLAIAHVGGKRITVVDAKRLDVIRTVTVVPPAATPEAEAETGSDCISAEWLEVFALFTADGEDLYLEGYPLNVVREKVRRDASLRRVDLLTGKTEAVGVGGVYFLVVPGWANVSSDGESLYALAIDTDAIALETEMPVTVYRLDADTLEVLAERHFIGWRSLILILGGSDDP